MVTLDMDRDELVAYVAYRLGQASRARSYYYWLCVVTLVVDVLCCLTIIAALLGGGPLMAMAGSLVLSGGAFAHESLARRHYLSSCREDVYRRAASRLSSDSEDPSKNCMWVKSYLEGYESLD